VKDKLAIPAIAEYMPEIDIDVPIEYSHQAF
jgi:hypothetical protein